MSKLGIGLIYFALVGALAAAIFGGLLIQKYSSSKVHVVQLDQSLTLTKQEVVKATAATDAANAAKDQVTTELTEQTSKVDNLNTQLAAAQKTADDANTALTQAKADSDKAKQALQHVTDVLGGKTPEEVQAAIQQAQSDLTTAQSQQKILEDEYQAAQKQVADLTDSFNREKTATMPPGISGKVTFVNRAWNFVVLNVGLSNGIVPNGELIVYRGRDFLGKLKVTSAESNTCVADILPSAKGDIQVGDDVLN